MLTRTETLQNLVIVPLEMYMLITLISSPRCYVLIFKKQFAHMVQDTYCFSFNSISTDRTAFVIPFQVQFSFWLAIIIFNSF